jgi:hypothetical protein
MTWLAIGSSHVSFLFIRRAVPSFHVNERDCPIAKSTKRAGEPTARILEMLVMHQVT